MDVNLVLSGYETVFQEIMKRNHVIWKNKYASYVYDYLVLSQRN